MLRSDGNVPHVSVGEIIGARDSKLWLMHQAGAVTVDVWAVDADKQNMARVPMGLAELQQAVQLLTAAAAILAYVHQDY